MNKPELDLSQCDREPIHAPGAVQPFTAVLIAPTASGHVEQCTLNAHEFLNVPHVLGRSLEQILAEVDSSGYSRTQYSVGPLTYLEFEKCTTSEAPNWNIRTREAMQAMQSHSTWQELLNESARQIHKLTGYDRVMIYRFHPDHHGEVIAESLNPGVESYLGLHYPASDIPLPARQIFLANWVRMIPEVNYQPVPFEPALNPITGQTPDLSRTLGRSVSPIHLEYLRNMDVGASLTLSILSEGKLWGLVACHHLQPKFLDTHARGACEIIARFLSGLLRDVARVEEFNEREKLREIHRRIVSQLDPNKDLGKQLTQESPNLMDLMRPEGAAVALYLEGEWQTVGKVPTKPQLDALVEWLALNQSGQAVYHSASISQEYPQARDYADIGSGLVAISIPKTKRNFILLFRPEVTHTVRWAGNPNGKTTDEQGHLHPRNSFKEWSESVRFTSRPWHSWEIDAALELRAALLSLDLAKQFEKEQKARHEAEVATRLREELMAVLSHDLKNPIGSILLQAQIIDRKLAKSEDKSVCEAAKRIVRAGRNMNNLIDDILHVTKLESGTSVVEPLRQDLNPILTDALDMLTPLALDAGIEVRTILAKGPCRVNVDSDRIIQVLSNLVGNSIKFTPKGGSIEVGIETCGPENATVYVSDTGPGIPEEHRMLIFDRFWQANQSRRIGTGLGLAICKGIISQHDGTIWVENRQEGGSVFKFTLPLA